MYTHAVMAFIAELERDHGEPEEITSTLRTGSRLVMRSQGFVTGLSALLDVDTSFVPCVHGA